MRFLVELSGEQPSFSLADALGAAEALGEARLVDRDAGVAVIEADGLDAHAYAHRLGLAHAVMEHAFSVPAGVDAVVGAAGTVRLPEGASFAVRARRVEGVRPGFGVRDVEPALGAALARSGHPVDLSDPDVEVRVLVAERAHGGPLLARVDRAAFEARHVKHRPFFQPVSLHPRFARGLVNLARIRRGERVLDPFAGTGGLLLEAALVGADAWASDLDPRAVEGTRATFEHFHAPPPHAGAHDVTDAYRWAGGGEVDVVLTDPPYGRSSSTRREELEALYERFLQGARRALAPGGRLAVVWPDAAYVDRPGWRRIEHHVVRVHRSLDRHFCVYVPD